MKIVPHFASKVTLVHRRDELRAERVLQERLLHHPKVEVVWNAALDEVLGTEEPLGVTGARLHDTMTGAKRDIAVDGVFIAIGHEPATTLFKGKVAMKDNGYLIVEPGTTKTNIPGVFAAGDVADETFRQAVTAAGLGCMAALEAERFLAAIEHATPADANYAAA